MEAWDSSLSLSSCEVSGMCWWAFVVSVSSAAAAAAARLSVSCDSHPDTLPKARALMASHLSSPVFLPHAGAKRSSRGAVGIKTVFLHFSLRAFIYLFIFLLHVPEMCPMYFYVVFHNALRPRQTSDGLICISFPPPPLTHLQIGSSMNLGLGCVCRPLCRSLGSVLDSRHTVFALTLFTLLMQVVVEANSWWYVLDPPPTPPSPSLYTCCMCAWCVFPFLLCVYLRYGQWRLAGLFFTQMSHLCECGSSA